MSFDRRAFGSSPLTGDADRTMIDGVIGLKIDLIQGPVRPYIMGGLGAFNIKDALASGSGSFSSTNFGVDGGGGLSIKLGRLAAFAETRIQNAYTKQKGFIDTKSIQSIPVSFGLIF